MNDSLKISDQFIQCDDSFVIHARLFEPHKTVHGCILLGSATGVRKEFYAAFAKFLANNNYVVMIFDYRGIGESRPKSLRNFKAATHDWGQKDMPAILEWLENRYTSIDKYFIGHSAGGQQMGFMHNGHKISGAILISSSTGYWRDLNAPYKYFTLLVWYLIVPISVAAKGYVPASWFGLGQDLPRGIALEWRSWCLSRNYFEGFLGKSITNNFFKEFRFPIHFIHSSDDGIANDKTVKLLSNLYCNAKTTCEKIHPSDYGLKKIGHFGFFSKSSQTLWSKILMHLKSDSQGAGMKSPTII